jgi:hypothetical protein
MDAVKFDEFVAQIGQCVRQARQMMTEISLDEMRAIDEKIQRAFNVIESNFRTELEGYLEKRGVTEKMRQISMSVIQAINHIDGYSIEPESGSLFIYRKNLAETQPLTPLPSVAAIYFNLSPNEDDFDFLLACLSQKEFFDTIQLYHYFRLHPSQTALNKPAKGARKKKAS